MRKPRCDGDTWTFATLLTHIVALMDSSEQRTADRFAGQEKAVAAALAAAEKAVNAALAAQEKAVSLAEGNAEKWRSSANEWRGAMDDREGNFVKIGEYTLALQQIKEIKEILANTAGRGQGWESGWKVLIALVATAASVVAIYFALKGSG